MKITLLRSILGPKNTILGQKYRVWGEMATFYTQIPALICKDRKTWKNPTFLTIFAQKTKPKKQSEILIKKTSFFITFL